MLALVASMEGTVDDIQLLLSVSLMKFTAYPEADCQLRIQLGMVHRMHQRFTVEDVDVHVVSVAGEIAVEQPGRLATRSSSVGPSTAGTMVRSREMPSCEQP